MKPTPHTRVQGEFGARFKHKKWEQTHTLCQLITQLPGEQLRSNLSRMAMVVWLFVAFVLTSSYTASLSSMLTVRRLEPSVVDVEWLKQTKAMVGCDSNSFVRRYLEEVLHFDRHCIKPFDTGEEYPQALRTGQIKAAFLEVPYINYLLAKNCKGFMTAGPTYEVGGFGFAFPKGSTLVADFSEAIVKLREDGKLRELEHNLVGTYNCSSSDNDGNGSLSLHSFWVLFAITGATSTLALFIFLAGRGQNFANDPAYFVGLRTRTLMMALGRHSRSNDDVMQGVHWPRYPEEEQQAQYSTPVELRVFRRSNTFP